MQRTLSTLGNWLAVIFVLLAFGLLTHCIDPQPARAATYRFMPECTIQAVVGQDDFTQVDVIWADNHSVTEYAYQHQYLAAERISLILTEFACDVRWQAA